MYLPFSAGVERKLAALLILLGILIMPDVIVPTFTDFFNIGVATYLANTTSLTFLEGLLGTFIFGFALFIAGILIYPYNTRRLLLSKMKFGVAFIVTNPVRFAVILAILIFIYYQASLWQETIWTMVTTYAQNLEAAINA